MAVTSITVLSPPPLTYSDEIPRPQTLVEWEGGVGPFDVLHEWDTVNTFDSANLIQDSNTGATSPDTGTPPSDMGPAGTAWFYRATVTDTDDSTDETSSIRNLTFVDPDTFDRFLHLLADNGVGFGFDEPAGGWGAAGTEAPDGLNEDFDRFLYLLAICGVGFDPTDTPAGGWGPADGADAADGHTEDFDRFLYLLAGDVNTDTPTPHIWYLFPTFGREGWEFQIIGYGFGDTQATYSGSVTLNGLAVGITSWELVAESSTDLTINPITNVAEPVHQLIRAVVPENAESGLVIVCTDGP